MQLRSKATPKRETAEAGLGSLLGARPVQAATCCAVVLPVLITH